MDLNNENILFFTRTMGLGGTENVVLQLCEIFKEKARKIVVCSCGGVNVNKLDSMGIKHYEIPDIENKNPIHILTVAKKLNSIVKDESISVIHTHHRMAAFYVEILKLYKHCVFINTSHNTFDNRIKLTQFAYRHANLVACGEMVKHNLVNQFEIPDNRVTVIHNAVKPFDNPILNDKFIDSLHDQGCFVIGNIGRLSEQKGIEYFIKSIPDVISKHSNVRILIVGDGELQTQLKTLTNHLNLNQYVFFLGYRNDVQNLMAQIDLVVLSSLWEGLPLTPIEAFSVGKTIVATAVDGTVEIVADGKNGFLIRPKDSSHLSEKINWLIEHPIEKKKMEKSAFLCYKQKFSYVKLAQSYIMYYEER